MMERKIEIQVGKRKQSRKSVRLSLTVDIKLETKN